MATWETIDVGDPDDDIERHLAQIRQTWAKFSDSECDKRSFALGYLAAVVLSPDMAEIAAASDALDIWQSNCESWRLDRREHGEADSGSR